MDIDTTRIVICSDFVTLHNTRNINNLLEFKGKSNFEYGSYGNDVERYLNDHSKLYWHVDDSSYFSDPSNQCVSFPGIHFWQDIDQTTGHRIDFFVFKKHYVLFNDENEIVRFYFEDDEEEHKLTIQIKRKLKKRVIKFHGKREKKEQQLEEAKKESNRWKKEGDILTEEEREAVRVKKREMWKQKHAKFNHKKERKELLLKQIQELQEQEDNVWKNGEKIPDFWILPRVCIDMSFLPTMDTFASGSIRNQLAAIYKRNLETEHPFRIYLCSHDSAKESFELFLDKQPGMKSWVGFSNHPTTEIHSLYSNPSLPVIYLSPDAEEELTEVDHQHIYVIGGICDRDRAPNTTKGKCDDLGLQSRKLPIDSHVSLNGTKILTINAVFSILCSYLETKNWTDALVENLHKRSVERIKESKSE